MPLQKRIFAGKGNLRTEPFCPYLSNESGYLSLRRNSLGSLFRSDQPHSVRPSVRDGKTRA